MTAAGATDSGDVEDVPTRSGVSERQQTHTQQRDQRRDPEANEQYADVTEDELSPPYLPAEPYVAAHSRPVELATDNAEAEAIRESTAQEARKNKARPILLSGLALFYLLLVLTGIWAAVVDVAVFDNLLRLYAIVVPVLTAALGAAAAYYFTNNRP